jgi:hypothetical protein
MADDITVTVIEQNLLTASSNLANPIYLESLDNTGDIDMTTNGKTNGSLLVYRTTTNKWTSTTTLDAQNMEGGEF